MRPAVRRRSLSVRAKQIRPHQGRRGVLQQCNAEILPGRQPPAVRHRAAHRGAGGGYGLRPARIPLRGLSQVGNGKLADPGPLPAGDLTCVKGGLGLGIPLHPGGHILRRRVAVVVGHRRPAAQNRRFHASGHRGRKGHRFRPDKGAAAVGLAGQRALAAGGVGDLGRQTLRHKPVIARGHPCGNGLRRPAEHIAQGMRKATGRSGQANVRRLPHGHAADTGRGSPGDGGQRHLSAHRQAVWGPAAGDSGAPHAAERYRLGAVVVVADLLRPFAQYIPRRAGIAEGVVGLFAVYAPVCVPVLVVAARGVGVQVQHHVHGALVVGCALLCHLVVQPQFEPVLPCLTVDACHAFTLRST